MNGVFLTIFSIDAYYATKVNTPPKQFQGNLIVSDWVVVSLIHIESFVASSNLKD